jgi:hypothetical protein
MIKFDQRAVGLTDYLQTEVGKDNRTDILYAGYIAAVKDFLQVDFEEVKETE